jgi:DNA-nicking Smr family endonuclease
MVESVKPPANILQSTLEDFAVIDDDERALFRDAVRDVRPLRATPRAVARRARPRARARFTREERLAVLKESLATPVDRLAPVVEAGEELLFRRPSVSPGVFRQLRRGAFRVEAECDLHGLTQSAAQPRLSAFIAEAMVEGCRVVRIVHGKGLGSGRRGPVLKPLVNAYLQRVDAVLAFASGREVDGGAGATLVLLARRRPAR